MLEHLAPGWFPSVGRRIWTWTTLLRTLGGKAKVIGSTPTEAVAGALITSKPPCKREAST